MVLNEQEKGKSNVNHPSHYNQGKYEVIDVIEDWKLNFNLGNAVKYIARCPFKRNKLEDLEKARWYIEREIKTVEKDTGDKQTSELFHEEINFFDLSSSEKTEVLEGLMTMMTNETQKELLKYIEFLLYKQKGN